MKKTIRFVPFAVVTVSVLLAASCCRLSPHEQSAAFRMEMIEQAEVASHPHERFIALMRLMVPGNDLVLHSSYIPEEKMIEIKNELDRLYYRMVSIGDVEAFQTIIEFDSRTAATFGVFGLMEIANRDDLYSPKLKTLRRQCLDLLAGYATHSNPDVRGAALYALGEMQLPEYKDLFISLLRDKALCNVDFPPLIESGYNLSSDVRTMAGEALKRAIGQADANEYINEAYGAEAQKNRG
jgi:hypothetical protein